MRTIYLDDDAVNALEQGKFIVLDMDGFYCKMEIYPLDEQIQDELEDCITIFEPNFTRRKG